MTQSLLADFILENIEPILVAWEEFARTIEPPALTMDDAELRDHAHQMLLVFAADIRTLQSEQERAEKSKGLGKRERGDTAAEVHAAARLQSGYTVVQLVSEYRALRSSVLSLWGKQAIADPARHIADIARFNEAVDQALAESVARYERLVKQSQNMFLAILGHDLRNPLGTVVAGASFLMQAADIPARYVLIAARMFSSGKRMNKLVGDLIDFTRTHLGPGIPIRRMSGDLVTVAEQVVNELRTFHPERQIELCTPSKLKATFDEGRIAQVLSNLIGNALQYGTPELPVRVKLEHGVEDATIVVQNQGPEIPADKISAIFDPLVRIAATLNTSHAERTSLGIGLFIAREIVQTHGGNITVTSDAQGTSFTFSIPLRPKELRSACAAQN
ncbi:ATP-binding protein [Massilia sp. SM-13]|uniref:ATP-binding protein n=1 Tax=Pseudoduganella rhizocola TaxID=3382643 RepID=UPI0038B582EA